VRGGGGATAPGRLIWQQLSFTSHHSNSYSVKLPTFLPQEWFSREVDKQQINR